jgi:hypothetical protein
MLFKAYPKVVEVQYCYGNLPLHFACGSSLYYLYHHGSSLVVLNLLISAYPEGIHAKDENDKLSSDYFLEVTVKLNSTEHLYLLHEAVKAGFCTGLVKLLLQAFPESCTTKNNDGMMPLHHACAIREQIILKLC